MKSPQKNSDTALDLIFPIPRDPAAQSPAQRWYAEQMKQKDGARFIAGDWHLNGEAFVFSRAGNGAPLVLRNAELRFGEHQAKRGFGNVCFYGHFKEEFSGISDDKRDLTNVRVDWCSQTITGTAMGRTIVFRVYPYQESRLRRFATSLNMEEMRSFIGAHMHQKEWYDELTSKHSP